MVSDLRRAIRSIDFGIGGIPGTYERVAADLDALDRQISRGANAGNDARMVLHFLGLIDDTLAGLAVSRGLAVPGEAFLSLARERREELMATAGAGALEEAEG